MWVDMIDTYCNVPGPADGYVRVPIYVDLTEKEYRTLRKKFCNEFNKDGTPIRCFVVTRSELPKLYDTTKSLASYKCDLMFRWLFKL